MLDAVGYYDEIAQNDPEKLLEFSDWMGIPIESYRVALDRFRELLVDEVKSRGFE